MKKDNEKPATEEEHSHRFLFHEYFQSRMETAYERFKNQDSSRTRKEERETESEKEMSEVLAVPSWL